MDRWEEELGQQECIGVRLRSLMALLRPVRHIRALLLIPYRCKISTGEIVELLHRVVSHVKLVGVFSDHRLDLRQFRRAG
ncbi:MAG TPA: hypothetical protein VGF67_27875 [Ktedonobacteraceae bacterium]